MSKHRVPRGAAAPARVVMATAPTTKPIAKPALKPASKRKLAHHDAPMALESAIERLEASVRDLKRERDSLAAELVAAKAQVAELDTARRAAIDRIDWVIDSLQGVLGDQP